MANSTNNVTHRSERRDRLDSAGYKLLWEVQTTDPHGLITVVSSWMPKYIPTDTNKGFKASIFEEDFILVERFNPDGDWFPNEVQSTSIYLHGNESTPLPPVKPEPVSWLEGING